MRHLSKTNTLDEEKQSDNENVVAHYNLLPHLV